MKLFRRKRRQKGQYGPPWNQRLGKAVFYAGIAAIFVYYYFALFGANANALRVVVPGSSELSLSKTGQYTIFNEFRSEVAGKSYDTALDMQDIELTITAKDSGQPIELQRARGREKYNSFSRAGYSMYFFTIDRPGVYVLSCRFTKEKPDAVLAVSTGFGQSVVTIVLVTFALVILTGGATAALFMLPERKRL